MTTPGKKRRVLLGESAIQRPGSASEIACVERDGERFYRIAHPDAMPPFFMSVVSAYDHWLFVSSTGGLTCGRRAPENALFPYCTDDKIHDARETTGPETILLIDRGDGTMLWRPFGSGPAVYDVERSLYKNVTGNKLVFEEVNRDLGLSFSYTWTTGNRFGFIRESHLRNTGADDVRVEFVDGLRNLLPAGVDRAAQSELSTLVDGYKQAEAVPGVSAALFSLSSLLTDRAEPSEALGATIAWSTGLDSADVLLSEDQLAGFCRGEEVHAEAASKGKRGAFFVHSTLTLPTNDGHRWFVIADVEQGPSQAAELLQTIRRGVAAEEIGRDIADGTERLQRLAGAADAFQKTADERTTGRHFSNTLFNIMRGGVFPHGYEFPRDDFLNFVGQWNGPLLGTVERALKAHDGPLTLETAIGLAERDGNEDFTRLVHEYLPLTFSRRHGDPSRPWNHFSILLENPDGSEYLYYQGNWRDIFQNWEALSLSFPGYIESFIAKFVNASTVDGYNPYRVSRDGIDWEVLEPDVPWSNIGYWGDHQVAYLLRLLRLSHAYHPGRLDDWLTRDLFVYADVPYRIKPYHAMLADPRDTVDYDDDRARTVAERVAAIGTDGKSVTLADGSIYRVNLLEKLLVPALAKIGNLVPGGGIWMNTQRPEWNDANNALVGHGLSMVTLCHLRRYLRFLNTLLEESTAKRFDVSREPAELLEGIDQVLRDHVDLLQGRVTAARRKSFMDRMGAVNDRHRNNIHAGHRGEKVALAKQTLLAFLERTLEFLDHSIAHGRREDGLYHAYNLIHFGAEDFDVEPLDEMLEGQVAVLSSGCLDSSAALGLLRSLRASRLYREDQNSYVLYPDRELPSFLDKNVIPQDLVEGFDWLAGELAAGRTDYVERDVDGRLHFNPAFRNANELRSALARNRAVRPEVRRRLCEIYESVFEHRRFTGRSGSMYKYEGLGCIYWHMVSKLLLATGETIAGAVDDGTDSATIDGLVARFREIQDGLGVHKTPADYGAFPVDPYSHTTGFSGVQQPGLTGQVKEDVIVRFGQLGVRVARGDLSFEPVVLGRDEFLSDPATWSFSSGGPTLTEDLPAGSLGFTLCGVPVVYRIAESASIQVLDGEGSATDVPGTSLGAEFSKALFRRDGSIRKLIVDVPDEKLA